MLLGVAIASMLLLGPVGLNTRWADTPEAGFVSGLTSCGTGAWTLRRSATRPVAALMLLLSLAATTLAGPLVAFMLAFGLMTGLGSVFALVGAGGDAGMEEVGLMALLSLSAAAVAALCFASQAWAILQARTVWKSA